MSDSFPVVSYIMDILASFGMVCISYFSFGKHISSYLAYITTCRLVDTRNSSWVMLHIIWPGEKGYGTWWVSEDDCNILASLRGDEFHIIMHIASTRMITFWEPSLRCNILTWVFHTPEIFNVSGIIKRARYPQSKQRKGKEKEVTRVSLLFYLIHARDCTTNSVIFCNLWV